MQIQHVPNHGHHHFRLLEQDESGGGTNAADNGLVGRGAAVCCDVGKGHDSYNRMMKPYGIRKGPVFDYLRIYDSIYGICILLMKERIKWLKMKL